jgi:hypothetical protein
MPTRPDDTGADAWATQRAILSGLGPQKRVELAIDLSEGVRAIGLAGARARHRMVAEVSVGPRSEGHPTLAAFLRSIVGILDDASTPHMLTGSLAAAYYSVPRATQDVDFVIDPREATLEALIRGLQTAGLYISPEATRAARRTAGQFNAIDPDTGWKADLIIRRDRPFSTEEFARRRRARLLGVDVALTSLEDLIVAKLEWGQLADSDLQRRDIAFLLEAGWASIDRSYVENWVAALGLEAEWERALAGIGRAGLQSG